MLVVADVGVISFVNSDPTSPIRFNTNLNTRDPDSRPITFDAITPSVNTDPVAIADVIEQTKEWAEAETGQPFRQGVDTLRLHGLAQRDL